MDPVQVWENHAGPIPPQGLHYAYVAYRDPELGINGYGNTEEAAILDFLEQEIEHICSNCSEPCSKHPYFDEYSNDCIMAEPNRSVWLHQWMPEDDQSHREWRELNPLPSPRNDRGL